MVPILAHTSAQDGISRYSWMVSRLRLFHCKQSVAVLSLLLLFHFLHGPFLECFLLKHERLVLVFVEEIRTGKYNVASERTTHIQQRKIER
mmetsp:Transcript_10413/g.19435  ORF Transcript_10413/g.19435 Transcript_10413/m.19435 type:complete len:91 (+) Transcript_10413:1945-2217(+)